MTLVVHAHGGLCCGIRHIRSFDTYQPTDGTREEFVLKSLDQIVKSKLPDGGIAAVAGIPGCDCRPCVAAREAANSPDRKAAYKKRQEEWITAVECVLAGGQYATWKPVLESCGFKEVFSFKNSNSNNMCHVFYGTTNPVLRETKSVESAPKDTEIAI